MFQSRAQKHHVVYLHYERWLFSISRPQSCSTNIINQKGKPVGLIRWHCNSKKFLKSFLKKIWIKWIVSLCDEMVEARHFSDTWSWQSCNITDNTGMFLFTFQAWMVPVPKRHRGNYAKSRTNKLRQPILWFINIEKVENKVGCTFLLAVSLRSY